MVSDTKKGFKQWLHRKTAPKVPNQGVITPEMREKALEMRRNETALRQKEKEISMAQRIADISTIINPQSGPMDKLVESVLPILLARMGENSGTNTPTAISNEQQTLLSQTGKVYTPEEIKKLVANNPKLVAHAKNFKDDEIKEYLIQQDAQLSAQTIQEIILEVRK